LAQLGKREAAAQVFAQVAEQLGVRDEYGLTQLVRAEVRSGRYDLACEHLGMALARMDPDNNRGASTRQDAYELLFEADADSASYWFRALRKAKPENEPPGTTMKRVRALLTGSATAADLDRAMKAARQNVPSAGTYEAEQRAMAIAAAYRAAGKLDEAIVTLADAAGKPPAPDVPPALEPTPGGTTAGGAGRGCSAPTRGSGSGRTSATC
jgi:hypothetical protein